nr:hypothetical protein [Anaerolineae bacterium]
MLLRAYRLTDRSALILLKAVLGVATLTADLVQWVLGRPTPPRRGLLGVFGLIGMLLWRVLAVLGGVLGLGGKVVTRGVGVAAGGARTGVQGAMARRAARAEMRAAIPEDPLRARNRTLSALLAVSLAGVIGVVIWATQPRQTVTPASLPDPNLALALLTNPQTT